MKDLERFIAGYRAFKKDYFGSDDSIFSPLKQGQNPKTMIIGCSDSRVDPAILTGSEPGDIFVVRNVANLVPPYEENGGQHGVSAALEFAVCILGIEHIIVLGHSQCGGIHALMTGFEGREGGSFIARWMSIAESVKERIQEKMPEKEASIQRLAAEQAAILLSLENLRTFPFIDERVLKGSLFLHGWYFDLETGQLLSYDAQRRAYKKLVKG